MEKNKILLTKKSTKARKKRILKQPEQYFLGIFNSVSSNEEGIFLL